MACTPPIICTTPADESQHMKTQMQTRIPSHAGTLKEMSPAGTNARFGTGLLPPGSIANKGSALPRTAFFQTGYGC